MTEEKLIRTFICIELPADLKIRIRETQDRLKKLSASISWIRPENLHLTLKFLGNVQSEQIPEIDKRLTDTAANHSPFTLIPEGQGVFPHTRSPRVFWVGIKDESASLLKLQHEIEEGLATLGFAKEPRKFEPHLTIGRVRPYRRPKELTTAFTDIPFSADPFSVNHITLMKSDLRPTGAVYTPLQIIHLKK